MSTVKELEPLLRELATKLGTTADMVFAWHVKQVWVIAARSLMLALLSFGVLMVCIKVWKYADKAYEAAEDYDDTAKVAATVAVVFSGGFMLATIIWVIISILNLLNPEYAAFVNLLGSIRGN